MAPRRACSPVVRGIAHPHGAMGVTRGPRRGGLVVGEPARVTATARRSCSGLGRTRKVRNLRTILVNIEATTRKERLHSSQDVPQDICSFIYFSLRFPLALYQHVWGSEWGGDRETNQPKTKRVAGYPLTLTLALTLTVPLALT